MSEQIHIRPRRGTEYTMHETDKGSIILKEGEIFLEFPDECVGKGHAKMKVGDGVSAYVALPYALGDAVETETVDFLEDHRTDMNALFSDFVTGKTVQILVPIIKRLIQVLNNTVEGLIANLNENYYTKSETYNKGETYNRDELFSKVEIMDNYYNKSSLYTKSETEENFYLKDFVYTKEEIHEILSNYYEKADVYTKQKVDELIRVPVVDTDPTNPEVGDRWVLK